MAMGSRVSRSGAGSADQDGAEPSYTVVETARGYLYLVLIPSAGKFLYDARTLAATAEGAEAALRQAVGEELLGGVSYIPPEQMLARVIEIWIEPEAEQSPPSPDA
jgi:hypothetical protein